MSADRDPKIKLALEGLGAFAACLALILLWVELGEVNRTNSIQITQSMTNDLKNSDGFLAVTDVAAALDRFTYFEDDGLAQDEQKEAEIIRWLNEEATGMTIPEFDREQPDTYIPPLLFRQNATLAIAEIVSLLECGCAEQCDVTTLRYRLAGRIEYISSHLKAPWCYDKTRISEITPFTLLEEAFKNQVDRVRTRRRFFEGIKIDEICKGIKKRITDNGFLCNLTDLDDKYIRNYKIYDRDDHRRGAHCEPAWQELVQSMRFGVC